MVKHPYYPTDVSLPGWQPASLSLTTILATFFVGSGVFFLLCWLFTGRVRHFTVADRLVFCWFALTGIIHFVIEGAFVLRPEFYKSNDGNLLSEIWKEYSKADSRYATRDPFTVSMEAVTAFVEGPLCFAVLYGMVKRSPWRYTVQFAVSMGQLYGDVLYFATAGLEGYKHSRPEPLYFWFYFVFINSIWVVVPGLCVLYSADRISRAVGHSQRLKKTA